MSTKFKGYNITEGDRAKPARKRFTDPQSVYDVYDNLKTDDQKDAVRRTKIRNAVEGALPYVKAQLEAKGLKHMTNLNFYGLKGTIDTRADSILRLGSDTCDLVELVPVTNGAAGPDDQRVAGVIAEEFSTALRREGHTIPALSMMNKEADLYGLGPVTWMTDDDFAPMAIERGQLKFRGDGPAISSDHDLFMFESELPAAYLFTLLDNEELAAAEGWDMNVLKKFVVSVFSKGVDISNDSRSDGGLSPWETALARIKSNTFYETHQFDTFDVLHVYVREMAYPRGVTHIIVPGNSYETKKFLYYRENAYEHMDQCLVWLMASSSERTARSIHGIASYLVPIERVSDRMTGAIIDSAFRAARLTLQQTAPGANPTVSLSESGNTTIVAAGLEPVPNQSAAANLQALTSTRQFISQLGVGAVAGTELAPVSTGVKVQTNGDQPTKAENEILERRRLLKDENLFNQRVTVLDKIFSESFRRFMNLVLGASVMSDGVPVVHTFIQNCARRGVTPEMLKEVPERFMVITCRDLVLGAEGKYAVLGQVLGAAAGNLDEQGRKTITHDMIRLRLGRRAAERYCPVEGRDKSPTDQASVAMIENSLLKDLKPVLMGQDQWHWSHIPVHAQVLDEIKKTVDQGLAEAQTLYKQGEKIQGDQDGNLAPQVENPEVLAQVLEATSVHIQEHLAVGANQLGMKARAEEVRQMIRSLDPTIKALNLAVATQRRVREAEEEKRQREMEALQQQASEAEMQKALAKVQADKEVGLAKVQADKEVGFAKVQADRELNAGKLQTDREIRAGQLDIETATARAKAENEAASLRADLENRRATTDASIEASRRESENRMQTVRDTAAEMLATRERNNNVTGRETVPPAQVMSPEQAPAATPTGVIPV